MTTTDLKPGDIVEHPEKILLGIVGRLFGSSDVGVMYVDPERGGLDFRADDLDGWERVETIRPGHVQVRVDDLDPQTLSEWSQWAACDVEAEALVRLGRALVASQVEQGAESTPPADEKPTSATVTLFCPECGEAENVTVVMLGRQSNGERWFDLREFHAHTCPPEQPDEPTEFGARIKVTYPNGVTRRLVRIVDDETVTGYAWMADDGTGREWADLVQRGTVTLGWDE